MTIGEMTERDQQFGGSALVCGGGSIGQRHAAILRGLGFRVAQVSNHLPEAFRDIRTALADTRPDYVVVASETSRHLTDLEVLSSAGYEGPLLVEKPLCAPGQPQAGLRDMAIAYQLRFHPALRWMAAQLDGRAAISAQAHVGQHLTTWRPGRDYRTTESARREAGGGALNDLSHELDYLDMLFGPWRRVAAMGGKASSLEIETDDHFALLCSFEHCGAVTIELNYLDRPGRRRLIVNTDADTLEIDLVAGTGRRNDEPPVDLKADRDAPIRDLHLAVLSGGAGATDLAAARRTMTLIEAARRSASSGTVETAE